MGFPSARRAGRELMPPRPGRSGGAKAGQSIIETALLIFVVAVAMAVFFTFIRNAVGFRLKTGADAFGRGMLYQPPP